MSADDGFRSSEREAGKSQDDSATIMVVGKVERTGEYVHLDGRSIFYCRRAVTEFYQRARIVRKNGSVVKRANEVFLIAVSFDRRVRERTEAVQKIVQRLESFTDIPQGNIISVAGETKEGRVMTIQDVVQAIRAGLFPSNVIIAGDEPFFSWFDPLQKIFRQSGITPQYLEELKIPILAYS